MLNANFISSSFLRAFLHNQRVISFKYSQERILLVTAEARNVNVQKEMNEKVVERVFKFSVKDFTLRPIVLPEMRLQFSQLDF